MPSVYRNITPRAVADLVAGKSDTPPNSFVRDTALPGFAIRVGRTKSSYVIEGRSGRGGRVCRYTPMSDETTNRRYSRPNSSPTRNHHERCFTRNPEPGARPVLQSDRHSAG
jgi:hypothetical protein